MMLGVASMTAPLGYWLFGITIAVVAAVGIGIAVHSRHLHKRTLEGVKAHIESLKI